MNVDVPVEIRDQCDNAATPAGNGTVPFAVTVRNRRRHVVPEERLRLDWQVGIDPICKRPACQRGNIAISCTVWWSRTGILYPSLFGFGSARPTCTGLEEARLDEGELGMLPTEDRLGTRGCLRRV